MVGHREPEDEYRTKSKRTVEERRGVQTVDEDTGVLYRTVSYPDGFEVQDPGDLTVSDSVQDFTG